MSNMDLWDKVSKTDPEHTKKANVRGNRITAIAPQYQIMKATEQFGPYGSTWGFKKIDLSFDLAQINGLIMFKGVFFYPNGEFEIISSISAYIDNARTKPDNDFAKKVETDALTKALSKLGFNADVFMGRFDDHKYVSDLEAEKAVTAFKLDETAKAWVEAITSGANRPDEIVDVNYRKFIMEQLK